MQLRSLILASLVLLTACAGDESEPVTGDEADLTATSGDFKLSLNVLASKNDEARVHGLANQPIEGARAFIPDDEVGTTHVAPKSFTTSFRSYEVGLFLGGRPAFFSVSTSTEAFVARADLGVKMTTDSTAGIKVSSAATSVLVGGVPYVRVKGTFSQPLVAAKAQVNGVDIAGVVSGKNYRVDFPFTPMGDAIAKQLALPIVLTTAQGDVAGQLYAAFKMKQIALAQGDAYEIWPAPNCTPEVLACIQQPANAVDTAACGDAYHVAPCWKQLHP